MPEKLYLVRLKNGSVQMKKNIKAISVLSGFSQTTVSNVLNCKKGVKPSTVEKVLKAAQEIGYLNINKIDDIQLVMYKKTGEVLTETPLINSLLEGIENQAKLNGLSTIICNLREEDSDFEIKLSDLLMSYRSGIILLATEMEWKDIQRFQEISNRMVVVDAWFPEGQFDTVLMNNTDSFYSMVVYLYQNGHRQIGLIDSSFEIQNFRFRKRGFLNAMQELKLPYNSESFIKVHPTMSGAYEDMKIYLSHHPKLPTAFCVINDIIAFGVMKALKEFGYKIPEDVSLIGFDNMPFCEIMSPQLTTIDILKREMGEMAVRLILAKIQKTYNYPLKIQLSTSLRERESVMKII